MKPIVRRGLGLLLVIACAAVWVVSSGMAGRALRVRTCKGKETLEVIVRDSAQRRFVAKEDVEKWLDTEYRAYAGLRLDSVNLEKIESIVLGHSAVRSCEAWLTDDGTLHIELTQRQPAVRFDDGSNGYYCDADGFIFPLQARGSVDVPVVDGKLPLSVKRGFKGSPASEGEREWLGKILALAAYMRGTPWEENIRNINVREDGNLVLVPAEGREKFIFGPPVRIAEKFSLMERYYTAVAPSKEGGYYSTVDLRYKGQLVCRK